MQLFILKNNSDIQQARQSHRKSTEGGWRTGQAASGWFVSMASLCSRPRVTSCDEVVKINPPFHPAQLLACMEAALMEWIHTLSLILIRLDRETNAWELHVRFVFKHTALHVSQAVNDERRAGGCRRQCLSKLR